MVDGFTPQMLMAGMAAQLAFGDSFHQGLSGSKEDRQHLEAQFPDFGWQAGLKIAMRVIAGNRAEVAALAVLLIDRKRLPYPE